MHDNICVSLCLPKHFFFDFPKMFEERYTVKKIQQKTKSKQVMFDHLVSANSCKL